jgi:hypothetical protein
MTEKKPKKLDGEQYEQLQEVMSKNYEDVQLALEEAHEAIEAVWIKLNFFLKDLQSLHPEDKPKDELEKHDTKIVKNEVKI